MLFVPSKKVLPSTGRSVSIEIVLNNVNTLNTTFQMICDLYGLCVRAISLQLNKLCVNAGF
jgi:hypothetical protein